MLVTMPRSAHWRCHADDSFNKFRLEVRIRVVPFFKFVARQMIAAFQGGKASWPGCPA